MTPPPKLFGGRTGDTEEFGLSLHEQPEPLPLAAPGAFPARGRAAAVARSRMRARFERQVTVTDTFADGLVPPSSILRRTKRPKTPSVSVFHWPKKWVTALFDTDPVIGAWAANPVQLRPSFEVSM